LQIDRSVLKENTLTRLLTGKKIHKKGTFYLGLFILSVHIESTIKKNNPNIVYISNDGNEMEPLSLLPPSKCLTCTCSMSYKPIPVYRSSNKCGNCTVLMEIYGLEFFCSYRKNASNRKSVIKHVMMPSVDQCFLDKLFSFYKINVPNILIE